MSATSGLLMMGRSGRGPWMGGSPLGRRPGHLQGHPQLCCACDVKSSARLLCPPERTREFLGWDTPYVHDTVIVLSQDSGTTALGTPREQINARFWESVPACDEMRSAITGVDHAPCSPDSVPTCPSSSATCASTATSWTSMGSCVPL